MATAGIVRAAVFLARLGWWEEVPGGEALARQAPWAVDRLFFPHCKMKASWSEFAFAIDVSDVYHRKRRALAAYTSIFEGANDRLLALYEAEDQYFGRIARRCVRRDLQKREPDPPGRPGRDPAGRPRVRILLAVEPEGLAESVVPIAAALAREEDGHVVAVVACAADDLPGRREAGRQRLRG